MKSTWNSKPSFLHKGLLSKILKKAFLAIISLAVIPLAVIPLLFGVAEGLQLSELRSQIRLHIKDTSSTRQRYTDAQLNTLINEAQRDVVNASWIIYKSTPIVLVAGTTYYSLPTDVIEITRVTREFKNLPETTLAKEDASSSNGAWETSGGVPSSYFQDPTQRGSIGIRPYPSSSISNSTGTIRVQYIAYASDLSSDGDIPFNSINRFVPYHDLLIYYPCYKIFLIEGDQAKYQTYFQFYESRLILMRDLVDLRPNYLPGFGANRGP